MSARPCSNFKCKDRLGRCSTPTHRLDNIDGIQKYRYFWNLKTLELNPNQILAVYIGQSQVTTSNESHPRRQHSPHKYTSHHRYIKKQPLLPYLQGFLTFKGVSFITLLFTNSCDMAQSVIFVNTTSISNIFFGIPRQKKKRKKKKTKYPGHKQLARMF